MVGSHAAGQAAVRWVLLACTHNQPIAAVTPAPAPNEEIGMVVSSTMFHPVAWMTR
jgi:hypothetical protein